MICYICKKEAENPVNIASDKVACLHHKGIYDDDRCYFPYEERIHGHLKTGEYYIIDGQIIYNEEEISVERKLYIYSAHVIYTCNMMLRRLVYPDETILPDDYTVYPGYYYLADGVVTECNIPHNSTVERLKMARRANEIRRCNMTKRNLI